MKVLILGASGQIGHHLHRSLTQQFPIADIIGTTRSLRLSPTAEIENLAHLHFDPLLDTWDRLDTYDIIINAIGQIRESKSSTFEQVHIELVQNFLAHKDQLGNPLFIQISALGAGDHPELRFLSTKARADQLLLASHEKTIILRPSIVASPGTMLAQRMNTLLQIAKASMGLLPVPKGFLQTRVQPILIEDFCQIVENLCLGKAKTQSIINLVGPEPVSFQKILESGLEATEKSLTYLEIPRPVIDPSVRFFVAPMLPGILTYEQFQLLFIDNVAEVDMTCDVLGRIPLSTLPFWEKELGVKSESEIPNHKPAPYSQ